MGFRRLDGQSARSAASSPPSPVFDLPPMRFMAAASVACFTSKWNRPTSHPVQAAMSFAGSTSSIGTGVPAGLNSEQSASVKWRLVWSLMMRAYSLYGRTGFGRVACWSLAIASGVHVRLHRGCDMVFAAGVELSSANTGSSLNAARCKRMASSAISKYRRLRPCWTVPVKYFAAKSLDKPTASKSARRNGFGKWKCPFRNDFQQPFEIALMYFFSAFGRHVRHVGVQVRTVSNAR